MEQFLHYLTLPYLLQGVVFTLQLTALGFGGGLILGLLLAAMQLSRFRPLSVIARVYTVIYRGTPLILQLVFVFTALPHIGIVFTPMIAGGVALAMNEATFFAEIFRSGVIGVDRGQVLAGQALGMQPSRILRHVVGPQAGRAIIPALGNEAVATMKNSALASIIAVPELTLRSGQLASATFDYFSIYFASGVMYLLITGAIALVQLLLEDAVDLDRTHRASLVSLILRRRRPTTAPPRVDEAVVLDALAAAPPPTALPRAARVVRERSGKPLIEISGLHKAYGSNPVLRGIDLTVHEGEVVALLGPSGSGKSTLLRTINHLESIDSGTVLLGGRPLGYRPNGTSLPEKAIAEQRVAAGVGMLFQHFNLFAHLTAQENVAGPLRWVEGLSPELARERATALIRRVGLSDRADMLPRHLSGGQQQRVAIARALAAEPRILLLDEPTSALDPELVAEVLDVIRELAVKDGLTMVIATHQLGFARDVADRVIFMAGGVVVEEGPSAELINNPRSPLLARFLQAMGAVDAHV
jgi:polar amino acid transport system permease protein